jgi:hypothetical protein
LVFGVASVLVGGGASVSAAKAPRDHAQVSFEADRSNARPLRGKETVGLIYVFVGEDAAIRRVRFFLDDPEMTGRPTAIRVMPPFDLRGRTSSGDARPFDTKRLAHGRHTLTAAVDLQTGLTRVLQSPFWVPRLFVSVSGADSSRCSPTAPCQSFDRAYELARPGQVVEVTPGEYAAQVIAGDKAAPGVVFELQGSHLPELVVYASNVEFRNGQIDLWAWYQSGPSLPDNVTFRNIRAHSFYMNGGSNIRVLGGELGPNGCGPFGYGNINWIISDGASPIRNVLIDGVTVHDNRTCMPGEHYEAVRIDRFASGVTIRNSRFASNEIFHIFITDASLNDATVPRDITIENNTFDRPIYGGFAIKTQEPNVQTCTNYTIRNNRFANAGAIGLICPKKVNVVVNGNTFG